MNSITFNILTDDDFIQSVAQSVKKALDHSKWIPTGRSILETSRTTYFSCDTIEIDMHVYKIACKIYINAQKTLNLTNDNSEDEYKLTTINIEFPINYFYIEEYSIDGEKEEDIDVVTEDVYMLADAVEKTILKMFEE